MVSEVSGLPPMSEKRWLTSSTTSCGSDRPPVTRARYSGISSTTSGVPWASSRTASAMARLAGNIFANEFHYGLDVFDWRAGHDPMAQVKDVSRPGGSLVENLVNALPDQFRLGKER